MENSATSRVCTQDQDQATSFHEDSSSWTSYMDDLLMFDSTYSTSSDHHNNNNPHFSSSSHYDFFLSQQYCSSASHGGAYSSTTSSHQNKRKKTTVAADDDLEDTATSPPHPAAIVSKGEGSVYGEVEDRIEVGFVGRDKNCSSGLKHIGLCLVPVSMAVNYFG